jgi:GGDEF domain-containing protein
LSAGPNVTASPWFLLLATVVAFNTLLYVGLTLSKILPWPRQLRPSLVRRLLPGLRLRPGRMVARVQRSYPEDEELRASRRRYRAARHGIVLALTMGGSVVMLLAVVAGVVGRRVPFWVNGVGYVVGLALLIAGAVLWYLPFRAPVAIWTFAVAATAVVLLLVAESLQFGSVVASTVALTLMAVYMPVLLDRLAALVSGAAMLVGVVVLAVADGGADASALVALAAGALVISAAWLVVRLRTFRDVAGSQARSTTAGVTDAPTGLLTEHGLLTALAARAAGASWAGSPLSVVGVRITSLLLDEQRYGRGYATAVVATVAAAVRAGVPADDLVARSAEDEILVVSAGGSPDADALRRRLEGAIDASGLTLGRSPVTLVVTAVEGGPHVDTLDGLLGRPAVDAPEPAPDWSRDT